MEASGYTYCYHALNLFQSDWKNCSKFYVRIDLKQLSLVEPANEEFTVKQSIV